MNKCEFCNQWHHGHCPDNLRDTMHKNKSLEEESNWREPTYGQRLYDGFLFLHMDEDSITDKFGYIHRSG